VPQLERPRQTHAAIQEFLADGKLRRRGRREGLEAAR
jgi:hypothetical protein